MDKQPIYFEFKRKLIIIGFGSIGQSVLPLIFRHFHIKPEQVHIIAMHDCGTNVAKEYSVKFELRTITSQNYESLLEPLLGEGDFLLNLSVSISSVALIKICQSKGALYLDTCIEPWEGGYTDFLLPPSQRTNYALRESILGVKNHNAPTALLTHGANPGLISHFLKAALLNLAEDIKLKVKKPTHQEDWASLAQQLNIKAIHIAEHDSQISHQKKNIDEFVNTWSADGFIAEGLQPAELGWGTHERHWPFDANHHESGTKSTIYLSRPGASVRVRTWTPLAGSFHGFLITHGETISISDYFSIRNDNCLIYRPTVHYAYLPCPNALLSLHELAGKEWKPQTSKRLLMHDITDGIDELGILLMGHEKNAYWYGSQLSIREARSLAPHNNATTLQVSATVLAGMIWVLENPKRGVVEPEEIDHEYILKIALPYLGKVDGFYTNWSPINTRGTLFKENIDRTDPWQFLNIRV